MCVGIRPICVHRTINLRGADHTPATLFWQNSPLCPNKTVLMQVARAFMETVKMLAPTGAERNPDAGCPMASKWTGK